MTNRYGIAWFTRAVLIVALTGAVVPVYAQAPAPALPARQTQAVTPPLPAVPAQAPAPAAPTQVPSPAPAPPAPAPTAVPLPNAPTATPIQVQFVLTRYQGEKKLSSVPYTLSVTAAATRGAVSPARLRMGAQVAVPSTTYTPQAAGADGKPIVPLTSYNYRDIGTSIDARAVSMPDGRFELTITVEDSSVFPEASADAGPRVANAPVFRTFSANSTLLLRDAQTGQFTTATDKINGEVLRIEVTVRVVK